MSSRTTKRMDELLAHAGWLRALARSLVADTATADDLVQETWIAALAHPPREGAERPWLARVLRNFARQRGRLEGRREQHERSSVQPQQLPSASALSELMEGQRQLLDSVLELAEPYSSTVILRYYEGLSAAEIARRKGLPQATVRSHLKRALELLRVRLDGKHGGCREAWSALLLPPVTSGSPPPFGLLATLTRGGLTVSTGTKLVAITATVVLLVAVGLRLGLDHGDAEAPRSGSGPPIAAVAAAPEPLEQAPGLERASARVPAAESGPEGEGTGATSQDRAGSTEPRPDAQTLYRSIEGVAAGLHSGTPDYTLVLELAIDLLERVDRAHPSVGASGQFTYRINDDSTAAELSLTVRDAPERFQDQYQFLIKMPDAPGFRGPHVARNGSRLQINFGFGAGKEHCSAMVDARFRQGQDLRQLLEGAGPTPVGGALTVTPEQAQWTGMTLEATSTEANGPVWVSAFTEPVPTVGPFWSPELRRARTMLVGLRPSAEGQAREH